MRSAEKQKSSQNHGQKKREKQSKTKIDKLKIVMDSILVLSSNCFFLFLKLISTSIAY